MRPANYSIAVLLAWLLSPLALNGAEPDTATGPRFPLKISENRRFLIDQDGKPFLIHGDSAWSLLVQLNLDEVDQYLADRRAKGFNAILVNLLEHKFADKPPKNRKGDGPFREPGNFATPNEEYFTFVDEVIRRAGKQGMCVFLCPAYLGYGGGDEGWFQEIKKAGPQVLRAYGEYLGKRYRDVPNLVWVTGGDYTPETKDQWTVDELANSLRAADSLHPIACHAGGVSAAEPFGDRRWLDLNTTYSYHPALYVNLLEDYRRSPVRPFIMIESTYENEHDAKPEQIRRQAYWSLLCGAAGQFFGNNPIWTFDSPVKVFPTDIPWKKSLDTTGAQDMARLRKLFAGRPWHELEPDTDHKIVIDGYGKWDTEAYSTAARTRDGRLVLVYVASPAPNRLTVDMTRLAGPVTARWYNPAKGEYQPIEGTPFPNTGRRVFQTPGDNGTGAEDWVLVLEASPAPDGPK
jgi:hypothetical protein